MANTSTRDIQPAIAADGTLALYVGTTALMAAAVAFSVSHYFGWVVAVPMALALTYTFSRLIKIVVAPKGASSRVWQLACAAAALVVFGTTMGLSYATLYARLFAETSALDSFQKLRAPVQRQLEGLVGHARTTAKAMETWKAHSTAKAAIESSGGGTCPAKAASLGKRGPIAMFREGEASIATDLNLTIQATVESLASKLDAVKSQKPADYKAMMRFTGELNAAIEEGETLAHGSLVKTTKATLTRQAEMQITWPNGEVFSCGDIARDELLKKAQTSLDELAKAPSLAPLMPAIDLANPQAVTNRGLLRSYNSLAALVSNGMIGQFSDDPLMVEALKKGVINQETLGMFIAALFELMVLLSSALVAQRGSSPFPLDPEALVEGYETRAATASSGYVRAINAVALNVAKLFFNLFWANAPQPSPTHAGAGHIAPVTYADPAYPEREINWAIERLAPYMVSLHDEDYVCIPAGGNSRATMAARALAFNGAIGLMNTQVPWSKIATNRIAATHLQKLVPGAYGMSWEVYKLLPNFAQAMRINLLR